MARSAPKFYYLVWSPLLTSRANSVMIFNTCLAIARIRPDWQIKLLFSEIEEEVAELSRYFAVDEIPNLELGLIFPPEMNLSHTQVGMILKGIGGNELADKARICEAFWKNELTGESVLMTRNQAVIDYFKLNRIADIPLFLELHQLKYMSLAPSLRHGSLTKVKALLREQRGREIQSIKGADKVYCISASLARRIKKDAPGLDTEILPSAAKFKHAEDPEKSSRDIDLIYTGQLYHWKGVHTIIEALCYLPEAVRLTILGGNNKADLYILQQFARNLGVAERINWLGQLSHHEVLQYQRRAKVGLVPLPFRYHISRWFTSPIKVFEMIAAQLPMVVADLPSMRDILSPGQTAEFARADDPEDWGKAIMRLLNDVERRERIARQALSEARAFTFEERGARIVRSAEAALNIQPADCAEIGIPQLAANS